MSNLVKATPAHLLQMHGWFADAQATLSWGGPQFRFPFDEASFLEDTQIGQLHSFAMLEQPPTAPALLGFGQTYVREGRAHLGRLAIAPGNRGRGLGKQLVRGLMAQGTGLFSLNQYSLFVLPDNAAAIACYRACGFDFQPYPGKETFAVRMDYMVCAP